MIVNNALLHVLQIPGEFEKIATGDRFFIIAKMKPADTGPTNLLH